MPTMTSPERQIHLDLSRRCIETAIRRRYSQCLSLALGHGGPDEALEDEIELLKTALESLDFSHLRRTRPPLAGHSRADVTLSWDGRPPIRIFVDGVRVD